MPADGKPSAVSYSEKKGEMMKTQNIVLVLALITSCSSLFADELAAQQEQGYLSFSLLKGNTPISSGMTLVGTQDGFWSSGHSNFYPRVRCEGTSRTLDSLQIFTGTTVATKVVGKELVIEIAQYDVSSPKDEIQALKENECRNLAPQQVLEFKQTFKLPYEKSPDVIVAPLDKGYKFRYRAFPRLS